MHIFKLKVKIPFLCKLSHRPSPVCSLLSLEWCLIYVSYGGVQLRSVTFLGGCFLVFIKHKDIFVLSRNGTRNPINIRH